VWLGQWLPMYQLFRASWQMAIRPCIRLLRPLYNSVRRVFPSTASSGLSVATFAVRAAYTPLQSLSPLCPLYPVVGVTPGGVHNF